MESKEQEDWNPEHEQNDIRMCLDREQLYQTKFSLKILWIFTTNTVWCI